MTTRMARLTRYLDSIAVARKAALGATSSSLRLGLLDRSWLVSCLALASQLLLWHSVITGYFPTGDEIALSVASGAVKNRLGVWGWLTDGFHYYFRPYPEWEPYQTDFSRPVVNLLFWLSIQIAGVESGLLLIVGYAAFALVIGMTVYVAGLFGLRPLFTLMAVLVSYFTPAYWSRGSDGLPIPPLVQFPTYQMEVVCALFMLLAYTAFIRQRFGVFAAVATVGVLTKEAAVVVPLCALALTGCWVSNRPAETLRRLLLLTLPLGLWLVVRFVVFQHSLALYVAPDGFLGWCTQVARNALYLFPSGVRWGPLHQLQTALRERHLVEVLGHVGGLLLNMTFWCGLVTAWAHLLRTRGHRVFAQPCEPCAAGLLFATASLTWALAIPTMAPRFGYFWFAVGPAAIFAVISRWRIGLPVAVAMGVGVSLAGAASISAATSAESLAAYRLTRQSAKQLRGMLASQSSDVRVVYLVDDLVVQTTSPELMAQFAGFRGRLVLVNRVSLVPGCKPTGMGSVYRLSISTLEYEADNCLTQVVVTSSDRVESGTIIKRGEWMAYQFPELRSRSGGSAGYELGRRMTVESTDPACEMQGGCVWVGLDVPGARYYAIAPE